jgi:hypothetical protein
LNQKERVTHLNLSRSAKRILILLALPANLHQELTLTDIQSSLKTMFGEEHTLRFIEMNLGSIVEARLCDELPGKRLRYVATEEGRSQGVSILTWAKKRKDPDFDLLPQEEVNRSEDRSDPLTKNNAGLGVLRALGGRVSFRIGN